VGVGGEGMEVTLLGPLESNGVSAHVRAAGKELEGITDKYMIRPL